MKKTLIYVGIKLVLCIEFKEKKNIIFIDDNKNNLHGYVNYV